ncbi:hypothetical protein KI387_003605, partial [Taxus chinensis]
DRHSEQGGRLQDRRPVQGGGHETATLQGGNFVTEGQEAKERGKKSENKGRWGLSRACG